MPNKIIDLDRLGNYDVKLKTLASLWQKSTAYSLNKIVNFQGTYLKCITAGTSGSSTLDLTTIVGNQLTDGTCVWEVVDPFTSSGGATISDWASSTTYSQGDLVINDNKLYQCNTNHTSTSTFDSTKWDLIGGISSKETLYTGSTWSNTDSTIVTASMSGYDYLLVDYSLSDDGSTADISKVEIFMPDILGEAILNVNKDSNNYAKMSMEKTSATGLSFTLSEIAGFTHYKINYVYGILCGNGGSGGDTVTLANSSQITGWF